MIINFTNNMVRSGYTLIQYREVVEFAMKCYTRNLERRGDNFHR